MKKQDGTTGVGFCLASESRGRLSLSLSFFLSSFTNKKRSPSLDGERKKIIIKKKRRVERSFPVPAGTCLWHDLEHMHITWQWAIRKRATELGQYRISLAPNLVYKNRIILTFLLRRWFFKFSVKLFTKIIISVIIIHWNNQNILIILIIA